MTIIGRRIPVAWLFFLGLICCCDRSLKPYRDVQDRYTVHFPLDWTVSTEQGAQVFAEPGAGPRSGLVLSAVRRDTSRGSREMDTIIKGVLGQYQLLPEFELAVDSPATVSGKDARFLSLRFKHQGVRYRKDQTVVMLPRQVLYVDCNGPLAAFDVSLCRRLMQRLEIHR